MFDHEYLGDHRFRDGCFAQDAVGDWYVCIPVSIPAVQTAAPQEAVGIDLGLKVIATTSDGDQLPAGRWMQSMDRSSRWPSAGATRDGREPCIARRRAAARTRYINLPGGSSTPIRRYTWAM